MSHENLEDLVAQFLARGGQVTKVSEGQTALNLSPREWAKAIREPGTVQSRAREAEDARLHAREAAWHKAHDAFFVGDHAEGHRILDEEG